MAYWQNFIFSVVFFGCAFSSWALSESDLQKELEKSSRERAFIEEEKIKTEAAANETEKQLQSLVLDLGEHKKYLQERLKALYKLGKNPEMQFLISSQPLDIVRNLKILKVVARRDLALVREYRYIIADIRNKKVQKELRKAELVKLEKALRVKENRISQSLDRLNEMRPNPLLAKRGHLQLPVTGEVTQKYGLQTGADDEYSIFNKGLFVASAEGSKVVNLAEGVVVFSDHIPGFGASLILDHGDHFYSVYSGLSRVQFNVGDKIKDQQTIAYVGALPSARTSGVYFEIRHYAQAVDPFPWIQNLQKTQTSAAISSKEKTL